MSHYYNTTQLQGEALKKAVSDASRQEDAIMLVYKNTEKAYSPSQMLTIMQRAGRNWPITSIRRAITNLEQSNKLTKTNNMVTGMFGKPEGQWRIK